MKQIIRREKIEEKIEDERKLSGYKAPLRLDYSDTSGGLLVYARTEILIHQLTSFVFPKGIEVIPLKLISGKLNGAFL